MAWQYQHPKGKWFFSSSTSTPSTSASKRDSGASSSTSYLEFLMGLIVCKLCMSNHGCCEFTYATTMSHPQGSISHPPHPSELISFHTLFCDALWAFADVWVWVGLWYSCYIHDWVFKLTVACSQNSEQLHIKKSFLGWWKSTGKSLENQKHKVSNDWACTFRVLF